MRYLEHTAGYSHTKCLMQRAVVRFCGTRRLATISVIHLYYRRQAHGYAVRRQSWTETRGHNVPIGIRRPPTPQGRPGLIRIDSVHQGDQDGVKGVYHGNAADCVTQFEIVAACERLSEAFLLPVIKAMLDSFPLSILGFHPDNGCEYIYHTVAELLDKLCVEFTKLRPPDTVTTVAWPSLKRRTCAQASRLQTYSPTLRSRGQRLLSRFHKPLRQLSSNLFSPDSVTDAKGRARKRYSFEEVTTPHEKLKSLPQARSFLITGLTFGELDRFASAISDTDAAHRLNEARKTLFTFH